jgi:hypothetical protein
LVVANLSDVLRGIGAADIEAAPDVVDAGFFHRTLSRWMGLSRERAGAPLQWRFNFLKAELRQERPDGTSPRATYVASLTYLDKESETVRYAIVTEDNGRIIAGTWLSAPPSDAGDVVDEIENSVSAGQVLTEQELDQLFRDDG